MELICFPPLWSTRPASPLLLSSPRPAGSRCSPVDKATVLLAESVAPIWFDTHLAQFALRVLFCFPALLKSRRDPGLIPIQVQQRFKKYFRLSEFRCFLHFGSFGEHVAIKIFFPLPLYFILLSVGRLCVSVFFTQFLHILNPKETFFSFHSLKRAFIRALAFLFD